MCFCRGYSVRFILLLPVFCILLPLAAQMQVEQIGRGMVAVRQGSGYYLCWRLLGNEPWDAGFNVYRGDERLNATPLRGATIFPDEEAPLNSTYTVRAVYDLFEQPASEPARIINLAEGNNAGYFDIPLQRPPAGQLGGGYSPNDASIGDLTGDGHYEIVLKWDPSNSSAASIDGFTDNVFLDAYTLEGEKLWRIDLGMNIRAGPGYTQFMVYDFDGDGRAEMMVKTAPGTRDGTGNFISKGPALDADHHADYRNETGRILSGPEYLTVFDGLTGAELATVDYIPARGDVSSWGDNYGNRVDAFLAGVAYVDGERPSAIFCRGIYTRMVLVAWDWRNGQLSHRWTFDTDDEYYNNSLWRGQGNHSLSVVDANNNGKHDIVYGSAVIAGDGTGMHTTGLGHGDALHATHMVKGDPIPKIFMPHEVWEHGVSLRHADSGDLLFYHPMEGDIGRGVAAELDPEVPGFRFWAASGMGLYDIHGNVVGEVPGSINHVIWWNGELSRELLDRNHINQWSVLQNRATRLLTANGASSINGTKANPNLQADLFGDWREEVIFRTDDNEHLRVYTTTIPTVYRLYTQVHDPVYRVAVAWQNATYNQPPHPGYYIASDMDFPPPVPLVAVNIQDGGCQDFAGSVWKNTDVGAVRKAGCFSDRDGMVTVKGSGKEIWGSRDEFQYVFRMLRGDGELIVQVTDLEDTGTGALAGVMFREGLHAGARYAMMAITKEDGIAFQFRSGTDGGTSRAPKTGVSTPQWLKLVRSGNNFSGYFSADNNTWYRLNKISMDLPLLLYAGMAVSSHDARSLCEAGFDNVELTGDVGGSVFREWWGNIPGTGVEDLLSHGPYPDESDGNDYLTSLELPASGMTDNYGTRIRGYLRPEESGFYRFRIAGSDAAELWLSADTSVAGAVKIAGVTAGTEPREWDAYPAQASEEVGLESGKSYYIEVLHKAGEGMDHLSVAWEGPDMSQRVIGGRYLSPWQPAAGKPNAVNDRTVHPLFCVYPNPFEDQLTIELHQAPAGEANYVLVDATGRQLRTGRISGDRHQADLGGIAPGIYFLLLYDSEERMIKKLIRQ